jgi:hypothetical protein
VEEVLAVLAILAKKYLLNLLLVAALGLVQKGMKLLP